MADKKNETTAVATTVPTGVQAFVSDVPDFIQTNDRRGLEDIKREDLAIPRLALAQALSPEVTEGDPQHIDGMKVGDLFNSLTGQIYGGRDKPVIVQIVRKDRLRAMQFRPIEDGGGVLDPNVPLDDERLKWGDDGEKPVATLFRDYLALILPQRELIALSFKSSGIAVAKQLNGLIALKKGPIFGGRYSITSALDLKPKPHQIYVVSNAPADPATNAKAGYVCAEDFRYGQEMWEAVKDLDTTEIVDRATSAQDSADEFDPRKFE